MVIANRHSRQLMYEIVDICFSVGGTGRRPRTSAITSFDWSREISKSIDSLSRQRLGIIILYGVYLDCFLSPKIVPVKNAPRIDMVTEIRRVPEHLAGNSLSSENTSNTLK